MVLKEEFLLYEEVVVLKKTDYLTVSTLEVIYLFLKELIFNSFYFGGMKWS